LVGCGGVRFGTAFPVLARTAVFAAVFVALTVVRLATVAVVTRFAALARSAMAPPDAKWARDAAPRTPEGGKNTECTRVRQTCHTLYCRFSP
jgi:hypothetical protein